MFPLAASIEYRVPTELETAPDASNPVEGRILAFRRAMHLSVWEIKNKMLVIKDFVEATDSLKKTLTIANTVRRIKKVSKKKS